MVSVHLDFASASARTRQVDQLIDALADRGRPLVLMGDFNCGWNDDEDTLRRLTETLGLSTPDPEAPLVTFPLLDARLDWIFVSDDVEIRNHTIHDDVLSDHRAVSAELVLNR